MKLLSDMTAEELHLAYHIRNRARELGPLAQEVYGNEDNVILDSDALLTACVEMIRSVRAGEV